MYVCCMLEYLAQAGKLHSVIVVYRVVENGKETVTVTENGVVTSHKVNGEEKAGMLEYGAGRNNTSSNSQSELKIRSQVHNRRRRN